MSATITRPSSPERAHFADPRAVPYTQLENKYFRILPLIEASVALRRRAWRHRLHAGEYHSATHRRERREHKRIRLAQRGARLLVAVQESGEHFRVRMNFNRPIRTVGRSNQTQLAAFFRVAKILFFIARFNPQNIGKKPDLQEMDFFIREGLNSLCCTPVPALMRWTLPGRMMEPVPILSLWASAILPAHN